MQAHGGVAVISGSLADVAFMSGRGGLVMVSGGRVLRSRRCLGHEVRDVTWSNIAISTPLYAMAVAKWGVVALKPL
ncbi:hypothetical protein E2C01_055263 [Portunus trituberculatus]|uniref:Uncharacterized protein n=1 Tax=Portunus trituberculatus TaxID=210409 RepID=A0A5B7GWC5_PORTR|nr:hypothetical protein [Portunus trituberculatus]